MRDGLRHITGSMTRNSAQGRKRAEAAAGGAAATAGDAPPAVAPQFSPALTAIDPTHYDAQLEAKVERIRSHFAEFSPPPLHAYRSRPEHYRMRWVHPSTCLHCCCPPARPPARPPACLPDWRCLDGVYPSCRCG